MPEITGRDGPPPEVLHVPLEEFDLFVNQSREHFDPAELQALADNILLNGQLRPGLAWLDPGRNQLVLICGERRFRALKLAGLPTMAVTVLRGPMTQGQMLALNLAENLQRSSLNPIERARGFQRLMQLEDLTASEVASRMNLSNATVSNALALLDLSEMLQARVAAGLLPASVGVLIARVADAETRRALADQYAAGVLDRDGVAREVNRLLKSGRKKGGKPPRLALTLSGLSVCVSGKHGIFIYKNLEAALARIGTEAAALKEQGRFNPAALAAVLKAS